MTATPDEMLETAVEFRKALRRIRDIADDNHRMAKFTELSNLADAAHLWPWVRLSEAMELSAAGYPTGHIGGLPPFDLWPDSILNREPVGHAVSEA